MSAHVSSITFAHCSSISSSIGPSLARHSSHVYFVLHVSLWLRHDSGANASSNKSGVAAAVTAAAAAEYAAGVVVAARTENPLEYFQVMAIHPGGRGTIVGPPKTAHREGRKE